MFRLNRVVKSLFAAICLLLIAFTFTTTTSYAATQELYLGGFPAGFILNTKTVEVVGICDILSDEGIANPARQCGIGTGDIIAEVNGIEVTSASQLNELINEDFKQFELTIIRQGQRQKVDITPVKDKSTGKNKLGLLVKDSLNGIGTVTYVDRTSGKFGSLGHPVADSLGNLTKIHGGSLYSCSIYNVKKGLRGNPGELKGIFDNSNSYGTIEVNCNCGIFGRVNDSFDYSSLKKVKCGSVDDVKIGKASIYTTLDGNQPQEYEISIIKTDKTNKDNRNYVIKIDDSRLLEQSGGIVQGMSGSPIIQDGKLIGAVTHVFINDPTRGYGISVENMLASF